MINSLKEDLFHYGRTLYDDMRELKEVGDVKEYDLAVLRWKYFIDCIVYLSQSKQFFAYMNDYVMRRID